MGGRDTNCGTGIVFLVVVPLAWRIPFRLGSIGNMGICQVAQNELGAVAFIGGGSGILAGNTMRVDLPYCPGAVSLKKDCASRTLY